jgi:DNA polymerase-3 subunit delta
MEKKSIARVAVFTGGDLISRTRAREELMAAIRTQHGEITEERFNPADETIDSFLERAMTPSLFQEVRVFSIRHVNALPAAAVDSLSSVLRYELPDVYLLLEFDENLRRKDAGASVLKKLKIAELVKKDPEGYVLHAYESPPDYKIADWLTQQTPHFFGRRISRDHAQALVDMVGTDLGTVYSELQKIDIHLPPRETITREDIEEIIGASRSRTPFELATALGEKNFPMALEIIDSLFATTFYAPPAIAILFRHFWALKRIRAFGRENAGLMRRYLGRGIKYQEKNEMARQIGIAAGVLGPRDSAGKAFPVVIKARLVEQAKAFRDEHLDRIFTWLREFDVGVKTGRVTGDRRSFELLCYRIVRVAHLEENRSAA